VFPEFASAHSFFSWAELVRRGAREHILVSVMFNPSPPPSSGVIFGARGTVRAKGGKDASSTCR
jgi:hypothetical protein